MKKQLLILAFTIFLYIAIYIYLKPLFDSPAVIFPYALHPFNIVEEYPDIWIKLKKIFHISNVIVFLIINYISFLNIKFKENKDKNKHKETKNFTKSDIFKNIKNKEVKREEKKILEEVSDGRLNILLGFNEKGLPIYLKEKALFQNILITGSIGTGKTSSIMYPITRQILEYSEKEKIGGLILDVKGNYYLKVREILEKSNRIDDLIVIDLTGNIRYNPLDKKDLNPEIIANRLKNILLLFSPETSESFWLDKTESLITEVIKFIRIYNDNYVDFVELSKVINSKEYYEEKLYFVKQRLYKGKLNKKEIYDFSTFIDFYTNEFLNLDNRTSSIIKSELSRITSIFISNYDINRVFCPKKEDVNFFGFEECIEKGKVVVLNMNISEYRNLSKIIAAYLKFDFQTEVLKRLGRGEKINKTFFISDEYQEYVTESDVSFYATAREAKCINVIATQSYTSLKNALSSKDSADVIIQNLINKIWFRNDDNYTIESTIKQIGKEEKEKIARTLSENSKTSMYNYITRKFTSIDSGLSESYNRSYQLEDRYNPKFFSQELETFEVLAFLSDGDRILRPNKIKLIPEFLYKSIGEGRRRMY